MKNEKLLDLINRRKLLAEMDKFANPMPNQSGHDFLCGISTAITEIEDAPTVDAVPVVRCKNCAYAKDMLPLANATEHEMGVCTVRKEDGIEVTVWGHGFCSLGERRTDEKTD